MSNEEKNSLVEACKVLIKELEDDRDSCSTTLGYNSLQNEIRKLENLIKNMEKIGNA